jgi:hypothetical protein
VIRTALALCAAAALAAAPARAQPAEPAARPLAEAVSIARGDECVDAAALVPLVEAWLGRSSVATELGVVVEADAAEASFAITRGGVPSASRRFDRLPPGCAERRAVVALAIALALDAAILESLGIVVERPPALGPQPAPEPEAGPADALAVEFQAEAVLALEVLPEVSFAGAASLALHVAPGVRVRAGVLATQRVGAALAHSAVEMSLLAGRADGCYAARLDPNVALGGCVGALAGAALAGGRGFAVDRSAEVPWIAAAARFEVRWTPWDLLALSAALDGFFALVRPRLELTDGFGSVLDARTLSPAGVAIALGAALIVD